VQGQQAASQAHLSIVQHNDAAHQAEHVLKAADILQVLALLVATITTSKTQTKNV